MRQPPSYLHVIVGLRMRTASIVASSVFGGGMKRRSRRLASSVLHPRGGATGMMCCGVGTGRRVCPECTGIAKRASDGV
jgi:hypothetical protein